MNHVDLDVQGRLIDHVRNTQSVGLEDLQALVLDEADRLLEMGFMEEVCFFPCLNAFADSLLIEPACDRLLETGFMKQVTSPSFLLCSALLFQVLCSSALVNVLLRSSSILC